MKTGRRILAAIVALCMAMGLIVYPDGVKKAQAAVSGDYQYELLSDGTVSISKYTGTDATVLVPGQLDGMAVTKIGQMAFQDCIGLTQAVLPDSVASIAILAFNRCESLQRVTLSDSLTSIGDSAFQDCHSLTEITIPDSVTEMGQSVFSCCENLASVRLSNNLTAVSGNMFEACTGLREISIPEKAVSIGNNTFIRCTGLSSVHMPESITDIGAYAFYGCRNLRDIYYAGTQEQWNQITINSNSGLSTSVTIHYSENGGDEATYEYRELDDGTVEITKYNGSDTEVQIPAQIEGKRVTGIGEGVFSDNADLVKAAIPEGVKYIGKSAFEGCSGLAQISISAGLESIGESAFGHCTSMVQAVLPAGIKEIGRLAFNSCSSLGEIAIPKSVSILGDGVFMGCSSLKNAAVPDGIQRLGTVIFSDCAQLENISIPDSVTLLGDSAFSNCKSLKEINIPESVTDIEHYAFYGCSSLADVNYAGTKEQWEKITIDSASGLEDDRITIHFRGGDNIAGDYEYIDIGFIEGTIAITKYHGSDTEVTIPSEIDGKTVGKISISAFESENLKKVVVPASVTAIPCFAFSNCPNLAVIEVDSANESYTAEDGVLFNKEKTELLQCPEGKSGTYTVPSGVVLLEYSSFHSCKKLDMIIVPDGVTKIGNGVFANCTGVTDIVLPKHMDEMGTAVFENCSSLRKISVPEGLKELNYYTFLGCSSLAEVEIPKDAAWIKTSAFGKCDNLKSLSIPDNVIKISYGAFGLESEKAPLEDIYYGGTREQWEKIEVQGGLIEEGSTSEKLELDGVAVHFKDSPIVLPEEPLQPAVRNPKEELESLKSADPFSLEKDFSHYLTAEQMDILESYLFTWLAEVNYAYQYSGSSTVKEQVMKKAGIDPQGDFASGMEQAITHVSVKTPFGIKTFEITMGLGKPDSSGNLYPGYSVMHYEVLEKGGIPSEVPKSGQIVRNYYADMGPFVQSVKKAAEDSLHGTYQWESLEDAVTAGILVDKNVSEIVGNRNGSFSDGTFTIFAEPLFAYSKIVHIACPVDVHVYSMDGKEAGSIVDNKPDGGSRNVRLDVDGDTKTVYLAGDDYYLNLRGTGTGTMKYEVEEIANEDVQRTVQFLELQLKEDMQYEGYVFRPLNIDRDMYALRTVEKGGTAGKVFRADNDSYQASFKKVQELSLSQKNTSLQSERTVQLTASHLPLDASNPDLRWTTDNESVAKVDGNGLVTAAGTGRATVTVSTKDGSFLKQFCVIDVAGGDNSTDNSGGNSSGNGTGGNGSGSGTGGNGSGSGTGGNGSDGSGGNGSGSGSGGNSSGSGTGGNGSGSGTGGSSFGQQPSVIKVHYVIQFNLNGGTKLSRKTMTLLSGDSPGIMPKAQRKGYTFSGWYTQQHGGEKVSGDSPLDKAATLYAVWAETQAPAKPEALTLISAKKGQIRAAFSKVNGAAGYKAEYSENKNFAPAKTKEIQAAAKSMTATGLKAGKKYYVRIRAYSLDSMGNRIYGAYSAAKSVKVKK